MALTSVTQLVTICLQIQPWGLSMSEKLLLNTPTIAARVTEQLREDIINKIIEPGSRITIKEVSERYGTSNMPVREAFRTLEGERKIQ